MIDLTLERRLKKIENCCCADSYFFDTYEDFPEVGKEDIFYIDKTTGYIYFWDSGTSTYIMASSLDDKVRYDAGDPTAGYVTDKIIAGGGITVAEGIGADENKLVIAANLKTVNSNSLLGAGDVAVQATLVSGTNIKTINSESLLGSGNIELATKPYAVAMAVAL